MKQSKTKNPTTKTNNTDNMNDFMNILNHNVYSNN